MKKIKLNKVKLALGLLGVIGATSLVAPILVSCGNSTPIEPEKPLTGITAKTNNDLTIWEMNAITADKKNWTVSLLSKAFDGINEDNIKNIKKVEVSNNIVTISNSIDSIKSNPTTNTSTVLTKTMTDEFFATGGIWASKNNFTEADLKGTTKIDQSAFHSKQLVSVIIPNTITEIGTESFQNNQLTSINIPDSVTSIGNRAFIENNFKTYSDIKITDKVLNSNDGSGTIKDRFKLIFGFDYPRDFEEINAKENNDLTIWELNAINNGYKSISLFSRVFNNIDANSFQSIKTAKVSNGVVSISNNAGTTIESKPTTNTETVLIQELTSTYFIVGGIWAGKTTFVEADLKGTTEIDYNSFSDKKLVSVVIPNTVTKIVAEAFRNNNLTSINIPDSVTSIGNGAFTNNQLSFETIGISDKVLNSNDGSGTIKDRFKSIFGFDYPNGFENITANYYQNEITIWEANALNNGYRSINLLQRGFKNIDNNSYPTIKTIEVSDEGIVTLGDGKGNSVHSKEANPILWRNKILPLVETNKYFAHDGIWAGKSTIGEAELKGTTWIHNRAFAEKNLTSVILPNTLTTIGTQSFYENKLTSIKIPDSVTSIERGAFIRNQFKSSKDITISEKLLNSTCDWKNDNGDPIDGDGKTVKENFELIFGVPYGVDPDVIVAKATNDLTIWENNAIAADKKNWTVPLLSKAFDNVKESNLNTIKNIEVLSDGVIKLTNNSGEVIFSKMPSNKSTILTRKLTIPYFATGGIWAGKSTFTEADLKGTTEIGHSAFYSESITSIILPNTLIKIGEAAVYGNHLTKITIPDSVKSIGFDAFRGNKFKSSKDITISQDLLNSTCDWKDYNGNPWPGDGKTVKDNFQLIFMYEYTS